MRISLWEKNDTQAFLQILRGFSEVRFQPNLKKTLILLLFRDEQQIGIDYREYNSQSNGSFGWKFNGTARITQSHSE